MNRANAIPCSAEVESSANDSSETQPIPPVAIGAEAVALFLDLDGTLIDIAEQPDLVQLAERTRNTLAVLFRATGGAVAIVTGRDIATVDAILAPLVLPVAGVHGLTRRDHSGRMSGPTMPDRFAVAAGRLLTPLLDTEPGLHVERKSGGIALHYRRRPELAAACHSVMEQLAEAARGSRIVRGRMVVEVVVGGADKGTAVSEFLLEPPFRGRRAVFAGDDATDEDAFRLVNTKGGVTIKIGPGPTAASYRCRHVTDFLNWLHAMAARIGGALS